MCGQNKGLGAVSNDHEERFRQNIDQIKKMNSVKCKKKVFAEYCWTLQMELMKTINAKNIHIDLA